MLARTFAFVASFGFAGVSAPETKHLLRLTLIENLLELCLEVFSEFQLSLPVVPVGLGELLRLQAVEVEFVGESFDVRFGTLLEGLLALFVFFPALLVFFFTLGLFSLNFLRADVCRKDGNQCHNKKLFHTFSPVNKGFNNIFKNDTLIYLQTSCQSFLRNYDTKFAYIKKKLYLCSRKGLRHTTKQHKTNKLFQTKFFMSSVNKVILIGNVGADPEVRYLDRGVAIATFNLATTERGYVMQNGTQVPDVTEWHSIVLWRNLAEWAQQNLKKSMKVYVEGKLKTRSWEKDGQIRRKTEVIAENIQILYRPEIYRNGVESQKSKVESDEAQENFNDEAQAAPEAQEQGGFFNGLFRN